uniref:Uncharacterized protein n=1 Tax=Amphimedon queenslandica TaxID=400682 RepID=A0A1X7U192_AMPQE
MHCLEVIDHLTLNIKRNSCITFYTLYAIFDLVSFLDTSVYHKTGRKN